MLAFPYERKPNPRKSPSGLTVHSATKRMDISGIFIDAFFNNPPIQRSALAHEHKQIWRTHAIHAVQQKEQLRDDGKIHAARQRAHVDENVTELLEFTR